MKNIFVVFLIILLIIPLASCCSPQDEVDISSDPEDEEIVEEQLSVENVPSREALYVYNNNQPAMDLTEVALTLNGEPLLLSSSYVRLVGVVSGGRPMALIEDAGRGLCLFVGDKLKGYRVASISNREVQLKKQRGSQP